MNLCDDLCDGEHHTACHVRAKGVQLSPAATPNRRNHVPPSTADPAWERGIAGERRPGGTFMPYLSDTGSPLHLKEAGERRRQIDERVNRLKNDPNVFASTGGRA